MACENEIYKTLHNILVVRSRKQYKNSDIYKIWHNIDKLIKHGTKLWKL